jgi:hypothetical protein
MSTSRQGIQHGRMNSIQIPDNDLHNAQYSLHDSRDHEVDRPMWDLDPDGIDTTMTYSG